MKWLKEESVSRVFLCLPCASRSSQLHLSCVSLFTALTTTTTTKKPWTVQQTTQHPLCHRQNRKSSFCPLEMASKTPCFICLKQSHLDAFTRPQVGLCRSSEQIGKQHDLAGNSQRAAITCSFANAPQLHRAHVWFFSGCPSFFSFSCFHSRFTSITCSFCCLYHRLSFFPPFSLSLTLCLCQPVARLYGFYSLFFSWASLPFSSHTSSFFSFTLKYVLVGFVSCGNASSDCILHPRGNNRAGILMLSPFSSPSCFPFVLQKWGTSTVNI